MPYSVAYPVRAPAFIGMACRITSSGLMTVPTNSAGTPRGHQDLFRSPRHRLTTHADALIRGKNSERAAFITTNA
jgi:hypothetical protein